MSDTITCPACGYPNDPGTESCENCGAELTAQETAEIVEPAQAAEPVPEPAAPPAQKQTQSQPKQQRKQPRSAKPAGKQHSGLQPEMFIRDGMIRIQMKIWQAIAFAGLGIAAIVLIISYLADSGVRQPQQTMQQQQMPPQGQQAPAGPSLEDVNAARQAVEANPNDPAALLKLSHLLHDAEMFDQAIVTYQRYMQIVPDNPDAQVDLGVCYYSLGQYDEAKRVMKQAVDAHPDHQLGHFNLGIVTLAQGDTAQAKTWFNKTIALNSGNTISRNAETILSRIQTGS